MFRKSVNKSQKPSSSLIVRHVGLVFSEPQRETGLYLRFLSIDPGTKNFAMRIETRYLQGGPIISEVMAKLDFSLENLEEDVSKSSLYNSVITFLNNYVDWFPTVHVVIIERQLPENYKMVRMSQHIITYCLMRIGHAHILEISPTLKTKALEAPPKLDKREVKKWSVDKALELLYKRGDFKTIRILEEVAKSKKDDLADTIIQIEAICKIYGWPLTI